MKNNISLPEDIMHKIITKFSVDTTEAIILVGSYARNNANIDSDIDITIYKKGNKSVQFSREVFEGYKLSIMETSIKNHFDDLENPEKAIWLLNYLQTAKIVYDPIHAFIKLQETAKNFSWNTIQDKANIIASHMTEKYTEEVQKIVSGIKDNNPYKILHGLTWLYLGLANVIAIKKGILLTNESNMYNEIISALGADTEWVKYFIQATGIEPLSITERGYAGLQLYKQTYSLVKEDVLQQDKESIEHALALLNTIL